MRIEFSDRPMPTSPTLVEHCVTRLRRALSAAATRVERVSVRIIDENGPRQGAASCQIRAHVPGVGVVAVRHTDRNYFSAASRAIEKLRQAVGHRLGRARG